MKIWEILKEENVGKKYNVYKGAHYITRIVVERDDCGFLRPKLIKENKPLDVGFHIGVILGFSFEELSIGLKHGLI